MEVVPVLSLAVLRSILHSLIIFQYMVLPMIMLMRGVPIPLLVATPIVVIVVKVVPLSAVPMLVDLLPLIIQ